MPHIPHDHPHHVLVFKNSGNPFGDVARQIDIGGNIQFLLRASSIRTRLILLAV
jgi:hypothetical protein